MNKHNNNGFSLIAVVAVIAVIGVAGFIAYRVFSANESPANNEQVAQTASDKLVLKNFGLASLDSVNVTQDALREYKSHGLKGFYFFGDTLANTGKTNPNFEFASVKPGTTVVSAIDGVVVFIREQAGSDDSEVFLQTFDGSDWMLAYDHLHSLQVSKGDTVKAGDVLGLPAPQGNGLLRFELQVNKKQPSGGELSYCPSALLDPLVKDGLLASLGTMMQQWETTSGLELYNIAAQNPVGCIGETVTP